MKRLLCLSFILLLTLSLSAANLLQNPGFEDWSGDTLNYWAAESNCTIAKDSSIIHSGNYSVSITTTSTSNKGVYQLIPVIAGDTFVFSAWVYSSETGSGTGMGILVTWRNADTSYAGISTSTVYNTIANTWELLIDTIIIPDTAKLADIKVRGYQNSGFAGYADDISFDQMPVGIIETSKLRNVNLSFSKSILKISNPRNINLNISVIDMAGIIRYKSTVSTSTDLNINLIKGVYFVVVSNSKDRLIEKISVIR